MTVDTDETIVCIVWARRALRQQEGRPHVRHMLREENMPKASWLDRIRQQLAHPQRRSARSRRRAAERLEQRELLSVSSLIINNRLQIVADGNEAIAVQVDPAGSGRVQVLVDSQPVSTLTPIQASALRGITITAGQGDNLIDLNAVSATDFSYVDPLTGDGMPIVVDAGNGNDTLFGSQNLEDTLDGGDGDDAINVSPANPITVGQVLSGSDGDDTIVGGTGNDTILGGDGFDSLTGGVGNDSVQAGDGNDSVLGNAGDDELHGDQGEDQINGGAGNDTIFGESGNDTVIGDAGDDSILGGAGADVLSGDSGTAVTAGNDTILGSAGNDTIRGNGGNDLLSGGDGDDSVGVTEATISVSDVAVDEGDTGDVVTATFIVSLSFELADTVTVDATIEAISASIGSDVQSFTRSLVFEPGVTSIPVSVSIFSDNAQEQTETFRLRLSNAVGAVISDNEGIGTISDNDAPPPSAFSVTVQFSGGLTASQQGIFTQAAQRIQSIIVGDVPDIAVPGIGLIDDVVIDASGLAIDGSGGVLGQAGPTGLRPGSFLPYSGIMQFDTADLATYEANGQLIDIITHEMMHVLGFGTIWSNLGLLVGAGSTAPTFIGPQATAEYNARFNQTGNSVPVEGSAAGPGSADSHWRESIFNNELMSPFINNGTNPISRVTVGQFADLGYQVNLNAADAYLVANSTASRLTSPRRLGGKVQVLNREKVIGLPSDLSQILPQNGSWLSGASNGNAPAVRSESAKAGNSENLNEPDLANIVNTITFDELPNQTSSSFTVEGATLSFAVNGTPSSTLQFNASGPTGTTFLNGAVLIGNTNGVLTIDFANPVSNVSFGVARNVATALPNGLSVEVFDANLNSISRTNLALTPLTSINPEAQFSYNGPSVSRLQLDFTTVSSAIGGNLFAIDNLRTDDSIVSGPTTGNTTIIGGNGNDILTGGDEADSIIGGAGDDLLAGGAGNDTLLGGGGSDAGFGGEGNDLILGQGAIDYLSGGGGDDVINGGDGADILLGDDLLGLLTGNDTLVGAAGDDIMAGGNGNDLLYGGAGRDTLAGEAGNDTLNGQGGTDVLDGGAGDDTIEWRGEGNDIVDVGDGQDAIAYRGTSLQDIVSIGQLGSILTLTIDTSVLSIVGPDEVIGSPVEALVFDMLGGNDRVTIGDVNNVGATAIVINGGTGNDRVSAVGAQLGLVRLVINGDEGNDSLTGSAGVDEITGGLGNDTINGGADNDVITGNEGDDVLGGDGGNDSLDGGTGVDVITGGDGDDSLSGGFNSDTLNGNAGNDILSGGDGNDALVGELGNDLLLGELGFDTLTGGAGDDTLDGGRNDDALYAGNGNDKLRGDHGDDVLNGGEGNDTLDGGDGNDTLTAGAGNDGVLAGDGDDSVVGGDGDDTLVGGDGADVMQGGAGNDILLGGDGDDTLNGNGATDLLSLGEGNNKNNDLTFIIDESFVLTPGMLLNLDASN